MEKELKGVLKPNAVITNRNSLRLVVNCKSVELNLIPQAISDAQKVIEKHGFEPCISNKEILARHPLNLNKAGACEFILQQMFGEAWPEKVGKETSVGMIVMGDGPPDEHMMAALKNVAATFRVRGNEWDDPTVAGVELSNLDSVKSVLKWLLNYLEMNKNVQTHQL